MALLISVTRRVVLRTTTHITTLNTIKTNNYDYTNNIVIITNVSK